MNLKKYRDLLVVVSTKLRCMFFRQCRQARILTALEKMFMYILTSLTIDDFKMEVADDPMKEFRKSRIAR